MEMRAFAYILCAMLLLALADMPYGFYTLLKLAACTFFIFLALNLPEGRTAGSTYLAWALALVYNPIVRIPLGKEVWSAVNILTVVACLYLMRRMKAAAEG